MLTINELQSFVLNRAHYSVIKFDSYDNWKIVAQDSNYRNAERKRRDFAAAFPQYNFILINYCGEEVKED